MEGTTTAIVLTADQVGELEGAPLGGDPGVTNHVLWHDGASTAGWLTVDGGHRLGAHEHRAHSHHIWVVAGGAEILDTHVGAGAYVFVPPGVEHDIDARATDGCQVFYLYVR